MQEIDISSNDEIFSELQDVLKRLNIKLRYDRGYFHGGLFRYRDKQTIYLNRADPVDNHVSIIISELKEMDLSAVLMSPALKELIQEFPES